MQNLVQEFFSQLIWKPNKWHMYTILLSYIHILLSTGKSICSVNISWDTLILNPIKTEFCLRIFIQTNNSFLDLFYGNSLLVSELILMNQFWEKLTKQMYEDVKYQICTISIPNHVNHYINSHHQHNH